MNGVKMRQGMLLAAKIAIGSSIAIALADFLHLQNSISAGTIALLTLVMTKWETMRLSLLRIITFFASVAMIWLTVTVFGSDWLAYGIFVLVMVFACELLGWRSTISVNAVIGVHFMTTRDFSRGFILNEFALVLIGITLAIIMNLFHFYKASQKSIIENMRYTEKQLQMLLEESASYLLGKRTKCDVWEEITILEKKLHDFVADAYEYQNNTFVSHPGYYIDYFEMRMKQCTILYNLHYEMKKIRKIPKQAAVIADYVLYLKDYVIEKNTPDVQMHKLNEIFDSMKAEPLPESREEFESRAILYHVLMDLEDFLYIKKWFVQGLNEEQRKRYWES